MSDDLEGLDEFAALYERSHSSDGRFRSGKRYAERCIERQHRWTFERAVGNARNRKVPVTLAGSARQSSSESEQ